MIPPAAEMLEPLRRLVEAESYSRDHEAVARCALVIDALSAELLDLGTERDGLTRILRRPGDRPVLLLCHYDTVWPTGTLDGFPFTVEDGIARGPGAFDMKAGIVQGLYALRETEGPVTVLFTPDEEIGSPTSREIIENEARKSRAVLVLEPAAGTALKVARKGSAGWRISVTGKGAHAGLEPEKGANASVELAHQILAVGSLARPEAGTSVTVTTIGGGSTENVVPESAWAWVDVRIWTMEEVDRLERAFASLQPRIPGTTLEVTGGVNRGPLERKASEELYGRLVALGYDPGTAEVGGASDGNFTAALGIPTLDGLGPVGGGAHARDEHVIVGEMSERAKMVARLLDDLLRNG